MSQSSSNEFGNFENDENEPQQHSNRDGSSLPPSIESVLRGSWPFDKALCHSSPAYVGLDGSGVQVEMVYGLLSMFSSNDRDQMSKTLLAMSSSDSCGTMRQSGCLPLIIQLLHGSEDTPPTRETRLRANQALHNIVHSHPDDKRGRRESRVLRLLEQIRRYSEFLYSRLTLTLTEGPLIDDAMDNHPCPAMAALMKLSFDEEHRHAMGTLGALHAIAELIRRDHQAHGSNTMDTFCVTLRRYAGMALTNLTFGDGTNKTLLCSFKIFLKALVSQLNSPSEELRQVTASVLRNLSWRADSSSKVSLREVGTVSTLTMAALTAQKESTLKVILSAVWNLSAHCSQNKADICQVEGALSFICSTLTYKSQSKTLAIVENGGGILRNISSHIAVRDDLREILRGHNTLYTLLAQLRSPSLTVVSNACGTLWNLSARCPIDQDKLWDLGAIPMLRSLINSKHKMISMGSSAALKNLLQAKPDGMSGADGAIGIGLPTLQARRQRALEQQLDPTLSETCDNIEESPCSSPVTVEGEPVYGGQMPEGGNGRRLHHSVGSPYDPARLSESRDSLNSAPSIRSTHSDNSHDRVQLLRKNGTTERDTFENHDGTNGGPKISGQNGKGSSHYIQNLCPSSNNLLIDSNIETNRQAKVANITNKYLNPAHNKVQKSSSHSNENVPQPKVNNFVENGTAKEVTKGKTQSDVGQKKFRETDLDDMDQPTDFSLRYNEDKDEKSCVKPLQEPSTAENGFFTINDDSLQSFHTEGTPYNFSSSTSLTDLRESKLKNKRSSNSSSNRNSGEIEIEDVEGGADPKPPVEATTRSSVTDAKREKPTLYCIEDTPGSISRFSSVSSISSADIDECIDKELLEDDVEADQVNLSDVEKELDAVLESEQHVDNATSRKPATGNAVEEDCQNACVETPLMFSRTTSVSSLSSFEVQSIHDDRSSVRSDFSRLASGAVSPSDLPDSPSQTVPTSPKRGRNSVHNMPHRLNLPQGHQANPSIFNEMTQPFNVEGTPFELSRPTSSLSSLTFDECDRVMMIPRSRGDGKDSSATNTTTTSEVSLSSMEQKDAHKPPAPKNGLPPLGGDQSRESRPSQRSIPKAQNRTSIPRFNSQSKDRSSQNENTSRSASVDGRKQSEEVKSKEASVDSDEKRLAELMKAGMPSAKPSTKVSPMSSSRSSGGINRLQPTAALPPPLPLAMPMGDDLNRPSSIPINSTNIQVSVQALTLSQTSDDLQCSPLKTDRTHTFNTEGTPGRLSNAGSTSDLSGISIPGSANSSKLKSPGGLKPPMKVLCKVSDEESSQTTDEKRLLEKCIQSAMPKPRPLPRGKDSRAKDMPPRPLPLSKTDLAKAGSPNRPIARVIPAVKAVERTTSNPSAHNSRPATPSGQLPRSVTPSQLSRPDTPGSQIPRTSKLSTPIMYPKEECKTYAVEGTPAEFSPSASLSDISRIGSDSEEVQNHNYQGSKISKPRVSGSNFGQRNSPRSVNDEVPQKFMVEDTPSVLSRHSSLSSIGLDEDEPPTIIDQLKNNPHNKNQQTPAKGCVNYAIEDTPIAFSRNSSLSSLSVDSGEETTPREKALLQQCISQGMPKAPDESIGNKCPKGRDQKNLNNIREKENAKNSSRIPGLKSPGRTSFIPRIPIAELKLVGNTGKTTSPTPLAPANDTEVRTTHSEIDQSEKDSYSFLGAASLIKDEARKSDNISNANDSTNQYRQDESSNVDVNMECSQTKEIEKSGQSWGSQESPNSNSQNTQGTGNSNNNNSMSCFSISSMSDSGALAAEALLVARAVAKDSKFSSEDASLMSQSINSVSCLENMTPPSAMDSLLSLSGSLNADDLAKELKSKNVKKMECKHTKKNPQLMRTLGEYAYENGNANENGMSSLISSCHSNIDNIAPPSCMDDMEGSMISVASISSEVVDGSSPPSLTGFSTGEIALHAQQIQGMLWKEQHPLSQTFSLHRPELCGTYNKGTSSLTLTAGDQEDLSTYHEITDLDPDVTLEADGDENEDFQDSLPDLPQDSPAKSSLSSHSGSPRLTPLLLRRRLEKERLKALTIADSKPNIATFDIKHESPDSSPKVRRITPKQRREENKERFLTRTISSESPVFDSTGTVVEVTTAGELFRDVFNSSDTAEVRRSFRQRRKENPERYQTRTIDVPVTSFEMSDSQDLVEFQDDDDLNLTAEQLEVLNQDANIVICSLNDSREGMMNHPSQLFQDDLENTSEIENIMDIETLSLISNDDEGEMLIFEEEEKAVCGKKARILKPGDMTSRQTCNDEDGKGIRGKRKGLYGNVRPTTHTHTLCDSKRSPVFLPTHNDKPKVKPTPGKPVQVSPKLPRATRASTLRQNSLSSTKTPSSSQGSSTGSSPRLSANLSSNTTIVSAPYRNSFRSQSCRPYQEPSRMSIRRENTFTKDEKRKNEAIKEKEQKSKPGNLVGMFRGSMTRRKDVVRPTGLPKTPTSPTVPKTPTGAYGFFRKRGSSAQLSFRGQQPITPGSGIVKSESQEFNSSTFTRPSKSSSLTRDVRPPSAKDVSEWNERGSNVKSGVVTTVKKDVTSKIASLWKKVEKAQTGKEKPKEDKKRVWISSANKQPAHLQLQNKFTPSSLPSSENVPKLVRSSTFEKERQKSAEESIERVLRLSSPTHGDAPRPHCLVSPTRPSTKPRPSTHPSVTHRNKQPVVGEEYKRISRLGSFIVVDEDEEKKSPSPQAVVTPFSHTPPPLKSPLTRPTFESEHPLKIHMLPHSKTSLVNSPKDDNGNATYF